MSLDNILRAVTLALIATLCPLAVSQTPDTSPIMAETDIGPITLDRLRDYLVSFGDLRDGALTSHEDWDYLPEVIRQTAAQSILLHLAEERGITDETIIQTELELIQEKVILDVFTQEQIVAPSYPTREEMWAQVHAHRADHPLPSRATFRFMRFAPNEDSPEEAMNQAQLAAAALASGESFTDVAEQFATSPSDGAPGEMLVQVEYEGQLLPELQEMIRNAPLQEPSEIFDTPIGPMIILVDWRELERFDSDGNLMFTYGVGLADRRREEFKAQLLVELEEKFGMETYEYLEGSVSSDVPAVIVGDRTLTLGDIRRRADTSQNPALAYQVLRQTAGLERLGRDMLLLCEADEIGLSASPEVLTRIETQQIAYLVEVTTNDILFERLPPAEPEEIAAHYENNPSEFETDLFTFEIYRLSGATLDRIASSELGIDRLRVMEDLQQRLIDGHSGREIAVEWNFNPEADVARQFGRKPLSAISDQIRDSVGVLASGECGTPTVGRDGGQIINVIERERGIPALEDIRPQVMVSLNNSRLGDSQGLDDDLLEEYNYRLIGDCTRVRWADEIMGPLTLVDSPTEE